MPIMPATPGKGQASGRCGKHLGEASQGTWGEGLESLQTKGEMSLPPALRGGCCLPSLPPHPGNPPWRHLQCLWGLCQRLVLSPEKRVLKGEKGPPQPESPLAPLKSQRGFETRRPSSPAPALPCTLRCMDQGAAWPNGFGQALIQGVNLSADGLTQSSHPPT